MHKQGLGWIPDYPDFKDLVPSSKEIRNMFKRDSLTCLTESNNKEPMLAKEVILSPNLFSEIEDQQQIGSCTANAGVALIEYYERKAFGRHVDASRLFLYKVTRNLMSLKGDTGASIKATMGAMVLFGIPPEKYWEYNIASFDEEPPAFCYSFAQNFKAIRYFKLDKDCSQENLVNRIRLYITKGFPSMFGFIVYKSAIAQANKNMGNIPYPASTDKSVGGHAVCVVGYNDEYIIKNEYSGEETIGAFMIRNSWGSAWGNNGYGWLPYAYVVNGMAIDWWCLISNEWIDSQQFGY